MNSQDNTPKLSVIFSIISTVLIIFFWYFQLVLHDMSGYFGRFHGIAFWIIITNFVFISSILLAETIRFIKIKCSIFSCFSFSDIIFIFFSFVLGVTCWAIFVSGYITLPLHFPGDEFFHNQRTCIEFKYLSSLFTGENYIPNKNYAIFYPSLSYLFNVVLMHVFHLQPCEIQSQRVVQYFWVLLSGLGGYLVAALFFASKLIRFLFSLVILTSPLLLAYCFSYYIEIPYLGFQLLSVYFLIYAFKYDIRYGYWLSISFSSLAGLVEL